MEDVFHEDILLNDTIGEEIIDKVMEGLAGDGSLSFVAAYKDGVGGVDGMNTADGIAVSPDGAHI